MNTLRTVGLSSLRMYSLNEKSAPSIRNNIENSKDTPDVVVGVLFAGAAVMSPRGRS